MIFDTSPFRPKPGFALLAEKSGAPVLPVSIYCSGEPLRWRSRVTVRFGTPIPAEELLGGQTGRAAQRYASARLSAEIQRIAGGRPLKITVAKTAGFCFGVNRAVETVNRLLGEGERVWTLGPIIHNPQTLADLAARGVRIAQEPREAKGGVLVIRSHGVARSVLEEAERCGARVVDATCPFVAKIHGLVQRASREGRFVLIAGDAAHPEVQGIVGHCDGPCHVFSGAEDLEKFSLENKNLQNQPVCRRLSDDFFPFGVEK